MRILNKKNHDLHEESFYVKPFESLILFWWWWFSGVKKKKRSKTNKVSLGLNFSPKSLSSCSLRLNKILDKRKLIACNASLVVSLFSSPVFFFFLGPEIFFGLQEWRTTPSSNFFSPRKLLSLSWSLGFSLSLSLSRVWKWTTPWKPWTKWLLSSQDTWKILSSIKSIESPQHPLTSQTFFSIASLPSFLTGFTATGDDGRDRQKKTSRENEIQERTKLHIQPRRDQIELWERSCKNI